MRRLPALRHRDFRLFWAGQLVSLVGTWMQSVGQAWLVLELTGSAFRLGVIGTLQFAPVLGLALLGGALSDRVPKRRLLLATQTTLMVQALGLAALVGSGHIRYWHLAVLATVYGVANALDMPARQSYVAELVDRAHLTNAIALNSAAFNGARVVGPALAGLVVGRWGAGAAFLINGVSFLAVLAALAAVRTEGRPRLRPQGGLRQELVDALRYVAATPRVRLILGLLSAVSLFVINYNVLVPLVTRDLLGGGAHEFGLLMAAHGAGALTGALGLAVLGWTRPSPVAVVVPALLVSAGTAALGLSRALPLTAVLLVGVGLNQILFMTGCNTSLQTIVPDELRGRLMGLYVLVFVGVTPFGALLVGSLAQTLGAGAACLLGGGLGFALVLGLAPGARRPAAPSG
jgi:MFS family permease